MRCIAMRASIVLLVVTALGCSPSKPQAHPSVTRPLRRDMPTYQAPASESGDPCAPARETPVEPNAPLTLQQALALALLHNPGLEVFSWELRAREAAILQQGLRPNPVLGAKVENVAGSAPMNEFEEAVTTLRISQLIELGAKRIKRTRLAQQNYALSTWDYETKRLDTITQVTRRYIEVLADQQQEALAQQTLALAQQLHGIVKDRARVGVIPTVEVDKALVRVSIEQIRLHTAQQTLQSTRQQLSALWGNAQPRFTVALGELKTVDDIPTQEQLMQSVSENPDIARWSTEIAQRQAALDWAQSLAIPSVTVGAGLRRFNALNENVMVFELGLPLPVINRHQGTRQQARYNLLKAAAQQRDARIKVQTSLVSHYRKLASAHHEANTLRDITLPAARAAYDAARQAFEQGLTNYIDVLDAERTLVDVESQYIEALSAYHQTTAVLEGLIGQSLRRS
jgi:cobalt-zinc-cadmium efflux system outer membrane protein